jgi:hypothetical protein
MTSLLPQYFDRTCTSRRRNQEPCPWLDIGSSEAPAPRISKKKKKSKGIRSGAFGKCAEGRKCKNEYIPFKIEEIFEAFDQKCQKKIAKCRDPSRTIAVERLSAD